MVYLNQVLKVIGIGAKVADAVVINPLSKILARTPFLPKLACCC